MMYINMHMKKLSKHLEFGKYDLTKIIKKYMTYHYVVK